MELVKAKDQFIHRCWSWYRLVKIPKQPLDQCWLWQGPVNGGPGNYGYIYYDGRKQMAHRFGWEVHHNKKIPEGKVISHKCNNPQCVSPYHCELATQKQNVQYMMASNRDRIGRKLTHQDVMEIRRSKEKGVELAKRYGVSSTTITTIRKHKYK